MLTAVFLVIACVCIIALGIGIRLAQGELAAPAIEVRCMHGVGTRTLCAECAIATEAAP